MTAVKNNIIMYLEEIKNKELVNIISANKCHSCHEYLDGEKMRKSLLTSYAPIKCDNCDIEYRVTPFSRIFYAVSLIIPILLINYLNIWGVILSILYVVTMYLLSPFLLRFRFYGSV